MRSLSGLALLLAVSLVAAAVIAAALYLAMGTSVSPQ